MRNPELRAALVLLAVFLGLLVLPKISLAATQPIMHGGWVWIGRLTSEPFMQSAKDLGMEYVIIQGIAELGTGKVFYYSDIFPRQDSLTYDWLETVLSLADSKGIKVFIGNGYFGAENEFTPVQSKQVMEEIAAKYSHHPSFYGWYHSVETSLSSSGAFYDGYVSIYNDLGATARRVTPNAKIMIAPYGTRYYNGNTQLGDQLTQMNVDIVAYQDEVGVQRATPDQTSVTFAKLRTLHNTIPSVALWADVESFDFNPYHCPTTDFNRFQRQLEAVAPSVDQIVAYEVNHAVVGLAPDETGFYNSYVNYLSSLSGDTQAPTVPASLTATAVSSSRIDLSWTASTDNVGVTGYRVESCPGPSCTNFGQIGTPTGTTFSNTGLTANTTYRYRVRATDAAGLLSGYSSIASATTQAGQTSSNLALDKPVSASSSETGHEAAYAVDSNASSRWSSQYSDPQWLQVDLGNIYNISQAVLIWETAYGKDYQIQLSDDGAIWTTAYTKTGGTGGTETILISGSGRYLRMYGTARGTSWGYSLWEMEVHGTSGSTPPAGLIGHWKFDETSGSTASDSSGNGNSGMLVNGPVWTTGKINGGLSFEGVDDYVSISSGIINPAGTATFAFWAKNDGDMTGFGPAVLSASGDGIFNIYPDMDERIKLSLGWKSWVFDDSSHAKVPIGTWAHYAVVIDSSMLSMYLDGTQIWSSSRTGNPSNPGAWRIGSRQEGAVGYYKGAVDDVRIYGRALSAQEVQSLYQSGSSIHKSDNNPADGCVSDTELFAFIDLWKVDSSNPTLKELIEAIGLWKRGGC